MQNMGLKQKDKMIVISIKTKRVQAIHPIKAMDFLKVGRIHQGT